MAFSLFNRVINYHVYLLLAHCKTFFIVKGHIHPQSHGTSKTMFFSQNSCCFFCLFFFFTLSLHLHLVNLQALLSKATYKLGLN